MQGFIPHPQYPGYWWNPATNESRPMEAAPAPQQQYAPQAAPQYAPSPSAPMSAPQQQQYVPQVVPQYAPAPQQQYTQPAPVPYAPHGYAPPAAAAPGPPVQSIAGRTVYVPQAPLPEFAAPSAPLPDPEMYGGREEQLWINFPDLPSPTGSAVKLDIRLLPANPAHGTNDSQFVRVTHRVSVQHWPDQFKNQGKFVKWDCYDTVGGPGSCDMCKLVREIAQSGNAEAIDFSQSTLRPKRELFMQGISLAEPASHWQQLKDEQGTPTLDAAGQPVWKLVPGIVQISNTTSKDIKALHRNTMIDPTDVRRGYSLTIERYRKGQGDFDVEYHLFQGPPMPLLGTEWEPILHNLINLKLRLQNFRDRAKIQAACDSVRVRFALGGAGSDGWMVHDKNPAYEYNAQGQLRLRAAAPNVAPAPHLPPLPPGPPQQAYAPAPGPQYAPQPPAPMALPPPQAPQSYVAPGPAPAAYAPPPMTAPPQYASIPGPGPQHAPPPMLPGQQSYASPGALPPPPPVGVAGSPPQGMPALPPPQAPGLAAGRPLSGALQPPQGPPNGFGAPPGPPGPPAGFGGPSGPPGLSPGLPPGMAPPPGLAPVGTVPVPMPAGPPGQSYMQFEGQVGASPGLYPPGSDPVPF